MEGRLKRPADEGRESKPGGYRFLYPLQNCSLPAAKEPAVHHWSEYFTASEYFSYYFREPSFIGIGSGPSGSTSLSNALNAYSTLRYQGSKEHFKLNQIRSSNRLFKYLSRLGIFHVNNTPHRSFEFTPAHLHRMNNEAISFFWHQTSVAFVFIVRDPVEVSYSSLRSTRNSACSVSSSSRDAMLKGKECKSFINFLTNEGGCFGQHMNRWIPSNALQNGSACNRVLFIFHEHLITNFTEVLKELVDFFGATLTTDPARDPSQQQTKFSYKAKPQRSLYYHLTSHTSLCRCWQPFIDYYLPKNVRMPALDYMTERLCRT